MRYFRLRAESPEWRERLCRCFYEQVYRAAFPKPDEAEGPDTWVPLMNEIGPAGQPQVYIILAGDSPDSVLGGIVFERYRRTGCWLASYIAVRPDARHHHVASGLVGEAVRDIEACGPADWLLFAEAEDPEKLTDADECAQARQRLLALDRLGMKRLPVAYVQPALAPDKRALDDLMLLCYAPDGDPDRAQISAARVAAFLAEFYAALGQANSEHLQRMNITLGRLDGLRPERLS
jgi:hypothetical protein